MSRRSRAPSLLNGPVPQVPVSASPVKISCARIHHDVLTAADDVDAVADLGVAASHQEAEIPEMAAAVIQHDLHAVACSCGRVHQAAAPAAAGAPGTVTYGTGRQAWRVYLMAAHVIPVHRCAELIRALIITAPVICAGETPIRAGPGPKTRKRYLLVACTNLLTCYFPGGWPAARDLAAGPDEAAGEHLTLFRHGVRVGLSQVRRTPGTRAGQPPARLLLECLHDRDDDVLRFLAGLRIPPTSDQAERDVRPAKIQQTISGRLRPEQATRHRHAVRGYISAAAKHDISVFTALRDALSGNPWMPPIPAST